jgi:adenylyltransferase/sulfurtransferase
MMTIIPGKTPCLSCLVHEAPPKEIFPVLGATPGVIGNLQVTETIKLITGIGRPVTHRLLLYDGKFMTFHEVSIKKDPQCPICGTTR